MNDQPKNNTPLILAASALGANVISIIGATTGLGSFGSQVGSLTMVAYVAGIVLAIVALSLSGKQSGPARGLAIASLALSVAEAAVAIMAFIAMATLFTGFLNGLSSLN